MIAQAHVNFALIKYWGKKDVDLKIPYQSSLSFTIDKLYTITRVSYDESLTSDIITINGNSSDNNSNKRIIDHMNYIRNKFNIDSYAYIETRNHVPTAAGLASSASGFAALTLAATKAANLNLSKKDLSTISRVGSGSSTRSFYKGFSIWSKGTCNIDSYASPLKIDWEDFRIIVCMIDKNEKKHSSSDAMLKSVEDKARYSKWIERSETDLKAMIAALKAKDIDKVGSIAEGNAIAMHELIESTNIKYRNQASFALAKQIEEMRNKGIKAYYTMDAGPNIKIITTAKYVGAILEEIPQIETIVCKSGPAAHIL